jgi:hypothetical protein
MTKVKRNHPPLWLDRFLSFMISERVADILIGDLHELYRRRCEYRKQWVADLCYLRDALDLCRPFAIRRHYQFNFLNMYMINNYIKVAARNTVLHPSMDLKEHNSLF